MKSAAVESAFVKDNEDGNSTTRFVELKLTQVEQIGQN
jgi:hypothetical protein